MADSLFWVTLLYTAFLYVLEVVEVGRLVAFLRALRRARERRRPGYAPPVSLIIPCRDGEPETLEGVEALLAQEVGDLEAFIVVAGSQVPPALSELASRRGVRLVTAEEAGPERTLPRVAGLLAAVREARGEVLAVVEPRLRPHPGWLRSLVSPLEDPGVGAATAFAWHHPAGLDFPSSVRSAWRSRVDLPVLFVPRRAPLWDGAYALTRARFDELGLAELWRREPSDAASLERELRRRGLGVAFAPEAVVVIPHREVWTSWWVIPDVLLQMVRWTTLLRRYQRRRLIGLAVVAIARTLVLPVALASVAGALVAPRWLVAGALLLLLFALGRLRAWMGTIAAARLMAGRGAEVETARPKLLLADLVIMPFIVYSIFKPRKRFVPGPAGERA